MRNFGSMKAAFAEANSQAIRLGGAFGVVDASPAHHATAAGKGTPHIPAAAPGGRSYGVPVFQYACRQLSSVRRSEHSLGADDNLVHFAGLTLTGYSDTYGAPSAILRR